MIVMDYHAILLQLGITPNYKGYHQMLTALEIVGQPGGADDGD